MADDVDRGMDLAMAQEQAILKQARMDVGVSAYQCEGCWVIIPEKRRLAYPGTRLCVTCKEKREQRSSEEV